MGFEIDRGSPSTLVSSYSQWSGRRPIAIPGLRPPPRRGLGDVTVSRALDVKEAQIGASFNLLATLGRSGSATPAATIRSYQTGYNMRWRDLQEIISALGHQPIANSLRELVADGIWGSNTAYTTALWLWSTPPPSRAADVPSWWRLNGVAFTAERDRQLTMVRTERAALATRDTSAPEPTHDEPPPSPTPTTPTPGTTRNGTLRTEGEAGAGAIFIAGVALVGIGLLMKQARSTSNRGLRGWSRKRRRR